MMRIDWHCDTITVLGEKERLSDGKRMVSVDGLQQSDTLLQCFAAFIPTGHYRDKYRQNSYSEESAQTAIGEEFERIHRKYRETLKANSEHLHAVLSIDDIHLCETEHKTGTLFTIEDGGVFCGSFERVDDAYEKGVRLVTLTWNHENEIGFPHSRNASEMAKGLKPWGIECIRYLEEKGVIIDVSHLSDGGFYDVAKQTKKPFIASHSNARTVCPHSRNLTDDMIRLIANRGGIIGLNYYSAFLQNNPDDRHSRIVDMVRHVRHIYQIGGVDVLALGSDFDGIDGELEIANVSECRKLADALKKDGFSDAVIEKMWYRNSLRVLKELL